MTITNKQADFLRRSYFAGLASGHPFPDYAACETALESAWGTSDMFVKTNDLFGAKRDPSVPLSQCVLCDTREEDPHGHWYTEHGVPWPIFPTWRACYEARLRLLKRLAPVHPNYAAALAATNGVDFVTFVSKTWSTWTGRAAAVIAIHDSHRDVLTIRIK